MDFDKLLCVCLELGTWDVEHQQQNCDIKTIPWKIRFFFSFCCVVIAQQKVVMMNWHKNKKKSVLFFWLQCQINGNVVVFSFRFCNDIYIRAFNEIGAILCLSLCVRFCLMNLFFVFNIHKKKKRERNEQEKWGFSSLSSYELFSVHKRDKASLSTFNFCWAIFSFHQ